MSELKTAQPYLAVDFGDLGGPIQWTDFDNASKWVNQTLGNWNWVSQQRLNPTNRAWDSITSSAAPIREALQQAQNHKNNQQFDQSTQQLKYAKNHIENWIKKYPWLLEKSVRFDFANRLKTEGRTRIAALIVALWTGQTLNDAPIEEVVEAVIEFQLFNKGIKDRTRSEREALKKLVDEHGTKLSELQSIEQKTISRFKELSDEYVVLKESNQETFLKSELSRKTEWENSFKSTQNELSNLTRTYDEFMALQSPVRYWSNKQKKHKTLAVASGVALAGVMVLVWTELRNV